MGVHVTSRRVWPPIVAVVGLLGAIGGIVSTEPPFRAPLLITTGAIFTVGVVWSVVEAIGIPRRLLIGARALGITSIEPNRIKNGSQLRQRMSRARHIRIFAVSGNRTVKDFGPALISALSKCSCRVQIIFSTNDDYLDGRSLTPIVRDTCGRLRGYLRDATTKARELGRVPGRIEIAFFVSHNRLPQVLCETEYGAFHIAVSKRESSETPFFELQGKAAEGPERDPPTLLADLIAHFDANWAFLSEKGLVGSIDTFEDLFRRLLTLSNAEDLIDRQRYITERARKNFNGKRDDRNYHLAAGDGKINHHFGLGTVRDWERLQDQQEIAKVLHTLELNQIEVLLDYLSPISKSDRVLDVGCGRGGTAISLFDRSSCPVVGINISEIQIEQAQHLARDREVESMSFRVMDFHHLDLPGDAFTHAVLNEVTMYSLHLDLLFEGIKAVLAPGARVVIATWCLAAADNRKEVWARHINEHYGVEMHVSDDYQRALARYFRRVVSHDHSEMAVDYFRIRNRWDRRADIEDCYVEGFVAGKLKYMFFVATSG